MIVHLVGCGKSKLDRPARAAEIYTGSLFRLSYAYAQAQGGPVFILSALHGLLHPDRIVEPYEAQMKRKTPQEREAWGNAVAAGLAAWGVRCHGDHVVFLAGWRYIQPLISAPAHVASWSAPLTGMGIGQRLAWLRRELEKASPQVEGSHTLQTRQAA